MHKGGEIGRPAAGTPNGCGGQLESAARSAPGSARSSDSSGYFSRSDGGRFSMRSGSGQHTEYIQGVEMKQGECICPLSMRGHYTATLYVMVIGL
jgi:hypothetical protein